MANSRTLVFIVFVSLSVAAAFPASAQTQESLTWQECIKEARQKNPDVLAAKHTLISSVYQEGAAFGNKLPQLDLQLDASRSGGGTKRSSLSSGSTLGDGTIGNSAFSSDNTTDYGIGLKGSQSLFSGFANDAKLASAQADTQFNEAALQSAFAAASFALKSAAANLEYGQDLIKLSADITKRRKENLDIVELRFKGGNENKGSYLLSLASLKDAEFGQLQAQDAISVSSQSVARALGRDESGELRLSGGVPTQTPPTSVNFVELANHAPAFRQTAARVSSAEASRLSAGSELLPKIDLVGQTSRELGYGRYADSTRWSAGINFSMPLYNGGQNYYGLASAQQNLLSAEAAHTSSSQQLLEALKKAYTGFVEAEQRIKVSQAFVEAATVRAEIARNKYNNGLLSFEDWDIIENDLITRQKDLLAARRDRILAEATWEQTQGLGVLQ